MRCVAVAVVVFVVAVAVLLGVYAGVWSGGGAVGASGEQAVSAGFFGISVVRHVRVYHNGVLVYSSVKTDDPITEQLYRLVANWFLRLASLGVSFIQKLLNM